MGLEAMCLGWLLIMDVIPNSKPMVTTVVCVQSEKQCKYVGAQREVSLRNDLDIRTDKRYTFTCVDVSKK